MGTVPTGPLAALYSNTTPGIVADPALVDAAIQIIAQTINDNWNTFQLFIQSPELGVADGAVTSAKLRDGAVTKTKIIKEAVTQFTYDFLQIDQKIADVVVSNIPSSVIDAIAQRATDLARQYANEAETNAKNASLPRTGGVVSGALRVNGEVTFADGGTYSDLKQSVSDGKGKLETIILTKGGTVSKAGSVVTFSELISGVNSIQQGVYSNARLSVTDRSIDIAPGVTGQVMTLTTLPTKIKLVSFMPDIINSSYTYTRFLVRSMNSQVLAGIFLLDSAGRRWQLSPLAGINYSYVYVMSLTINLKEGVSKVIYNTGSGSTMYQDSFTKPTGFLVDGPVDIAILITSNNMSSGLTLVGGGLDSTTMYTM